MKKAVEGGCKCGGVRYAGVAAEVGTFRCHCRDCQQLTGSGHANMLPLDRPSFEISGPVKVYEMKGGSGRSTFSGFCTDCGAPIFRRSERMEALIYVHAGSLDDPLQFVPQRSIYSDDAQPWDAGSIVEG